MIERDTVARCFIEAMSFTRFGHGQKTFRPTGGESGEGHEGTVANKEETTRHKMWRQEIDFYYQV